MECGIDPNWNWNPYILGKKYLFVTSNENFTGELLEVYNQELLINDATEGKLIIGRAAIVLVRECT